ncbi:hypothetical protein NDU88_007556 [Pleurodeles waltl]|uniref:Uncharacterized protein n=1 Tax=Pleurodeles waltl TaxID=8319 RepID=A0AAV7RV47_PLEWA|nr:hypothetical protein NDU88_007556 [Pleurodeles waltl]
MDAPLEHMIKTFSSDKKKIQKYCKQWYRDTKGYAQPQPKEGTFDEDIIEHTLTYIKSKYQKKKRKKREAILSLWGVFYDTKTNIKLTMLEQTANQIQERDTEGVSEGPPPYGLYPIRPVAGYQDPVWVECEEGETEVKGAEKASCLLPTAPRAEYEQRRKERAISRVQLTEERAERSEYVDSLRGQWTTGQTILKVGDKSASTLREAAGEWMLEEREKEEDVERVRFDRYSEERGKETEAEVTVEDWGDDSDTNEGAAARGRGLYNFRPRPIRRLQLIMRDSDEVQYRTVSDNVPDMTVKERDLDKDGPKVTPDRVESIKNMPKPTTIKQMQQFLGLCNYVRQ